MTAVITVQAHDLRVGDVIVARVLRQARGQVGSVKVEDGRVFINYTNGSGTTAAVNDELAVLRKDSE